MKHLRQGFAPIVLIVAVLLIGGLVGGGIYLKNQKEQKMETPATTTPANNNATSPDSTQQTGSMIEINASMLDLLARNVNLECDWTPPGLTNVTVSKVWVSGAMARSHLEMTDTTGKIPMIADAIFKDGSITSWVEAGPAGKIGFKMSKADIEKTNKSLSAEQKKQADAYMEEARYSCKSWTVDPTKFEVPSDVKFY